MSSTLPVAGAAGPEAADDALPAPGAPSCGEQAASSTVATNGAKVRMFMVVFLSIGLQTGATLPSGGEKGKESLVVCLDGLLIWQAVGASSDRFPSSECGERLERYVGCVPQARTPLLVIPKPCAWGAHTRYTLKMDRLPEIYFSGSLFSVEGRLGW